MGQCFEEIGKGKGFDGERISHAPSKWRSPHSHLLKTTIVNNLPRQGRLGLQSKKKLVVQIKTILFICNDFIED